MNRIDEYGRATTQIYEIAKQYMVENETDIHVLKISDAYKRKLMATGLRVKLYHFDRPTNTYWLPPWAWQRVYDHTTPIKYTMKFQELKDYQWQIIKETWKDWLRSWFIVSWTGTGKSYMMSGLIALFKVKTLIVVPNISIARWLLEKLSQWSSSVYLAQWSKILWAGEYDIVICHHTTFNTHYDYLNGKYQMLILDEWHHIPDTRIRQLCLWKGGMVFWLTATPMRKEFGIKWMEKVYGRIYDTWVEALPMKVLIHKFRYDYDSWELMNASNWLAPDSNEIFRRLVINNKTRYLELLKLIRNLDKQWYTKFIVFSDRVEHIERTMDMLKQNWFNPIWYYWASKKDESESQIKKSDKYVIVWHPTSCGEWFDVPDLEVSIIFTSTGWEWIIQQMAWRARRHAWNKKEWILVDFVDQLSIMGGKTKSLSFGKRMKVYKQLNWETTAL